MRFCRAMGIYIVRIDAQRKVSAFSRQADELDAVLGLAVDAPRRLLYAISTKVPMASRWPPTAHGCMSP
jgi:hypothetical protein